jgi:hypothetical protein
MNKVRLILLSVFAAGTLLFASCSLSTAELAEEVQNGIIAQNFDSSCKVTKDLVLVHKEGNNYAGLMTVSCNGETGQLSVDVVYDGENVQWTVSD